MAYYKDLREHIKALEANNKLIRVKRGINKYTELLPSPLPTFWILWRVGCPSR